MKKAELDEVQFMALVGVIMVKIQDWYEGKIAYPTLKRYIEGYLKDVIIVDGEQR